MDEEAVIRLAGERMLRASNQRTGAAIYLSAILLVGAAGYFRPLNDAVVTRWSASGLNRVKKAAWAMRSRIAKVKP